MKRLLLILLLSLSLSSCDIDLTGALCLETVSNVVIEPYSGGYYYGYNQYTVYTYDSAGNSWVYYDQTYYPTIGECWN